MARGRAVDLALPEHLYTKSPIGMACGGIAGRVGGRIKAARVRDMALAFGSGKFVIGTCGSVLVGSEVLRLAGTVS